MGCVHVRSQEDLGMYLVQSSINRDKIEAVGDYFRMCHEGWTQATTFMSQAGKKKSSI